MIDELSTLSASDTYPFHMPGHKRQPGMESSRLSGGTWLDEVYIHDITEIDGFDDLQSPNGIIADIETRLAAYYGVDRAFLSVNGSTCGNLSAISTLVPHGGRLLMDSGAHRSVYNAAYLGEIEKVYLEREQISECGLTACISVNEVKNRLSKAEKENKLPDAVLITSPTYDGFMADVDGIADVVHGYGIPLITDGAHGAHLKVSKKSDITVVSLHKTLPAMTQVSAVLVNKGMAEPGEVKRYINIFQTTSPSYILMSSAEKCLDIMEERGAELEKSLKKRLKRLYSLNGELKRLHLAGTEYIGQYGIFDFDSSKVNLIDRTGARTGRELYDILRSEYRLQPEKYAEKACLLMTSLMDTGEGFSRLEQALRSMDDMGDLNT